MQNLSEKLLCKAQRVDTKEWITGYYFEQPIMACLGPTPDPLCFLMVRDPNYLPDCGLPFNMKAILVDNNTVRMSAGIYAVGGELLFEGDAVKTADGVCTGEIVLEDQPDGSRKVTVHWFGENGKAIPDKEAPTWKKESELQLWYVGQKEGGV